MTLVESLESRTFLSATGLPLRIGGNAFDMGKRVAATPDGGYIAAGLFNGTVDFNPGSGVTRLTSVGDTDIYVAKYSSTGALQWVKQFGGDALHDDLNDQDIIEIAADPARAGAPFYNGFGSDPVYAAEYVNDLAIGSDGSVFLVGSFIGTVDFNPGAGKKIFSTYDEDYPDAFVVKLNTGGGLVWADQIGGRDTGTSYGISENRFTEIATAIALDASGGIYVTGLFSRTVSFVKNNPALRLTAVGREDAFVMKLRSNGTVRWVKSFGGDATKESERDVANDVAVDASGNVYVAGEFAGKADFNPSPTATSYLKAVKKTDGVLVKYNSSGGFTKAVAFSGKDYDGLSNVAVDSYGDVVVTGYFQGDNFDANPGSAVRNLVASPDSDGDDTDFVDQFVEKLDSDLQFLWVQQLAGTGTEIIDQLKIDASDSIVIGGAFYGTARFGAAGPTVTSVLGVDDFDDRNDVDRDNSYDAFLWRITPTGTTSWVRSFGGASDDFGAGIDVRLNGSILFTGRFRGTVNFRTASAPYKLTGLGLADAFVTGYSALGVTLF